ncbi:hypothetical protein BBJ28_00017877 [Nothophytophthora sp. Chile5]|nr:hypothetical protein BBJ28_00017877 [Nothophytophthora sp. Chile5]
MTLLRFGLRPLGGASRQALRQSLWAPACASSGLNGAPTWKRWLATEAAAAEPGKLVKRKVAIVSGYMGTGYHGVQMNDDVQTIEDELRNAIFKAGAMRESNFEDLGKIDWSRSSRTDKGENAVDRATGRVKGLAEALNASLPPTIRVFSCTRVNKRFAARKNCVLRAYEYFMPLSFLKDSVIRSEKEGAESFDTDAAVAEFCRALRRYEGVHDFHNFTKSRSHFYKAHAMRLQWKAQNGKSAVEANGDELDDEAKLQGVASDEEMVESDEADEGEKSAVDNDDIAEASQYEDDEETTRKLLPRHRRSIYSCTGSLIPYFGGEPYLRVHIVGQAFLLNQIRCMVGGALAVATNGMSRTAFDAALSTNRIVRVPIAPAEGLVLLSSSFGGKLHTVSLYKDSNTVLAEERKDLVHRVLLNHREDQEMKKFREEVIYNEVANSWKMEEKIEGWRTYLERSYEANETLDENELADLLNEMDRAKQERQSKRHSFVQQNRVEVAEGGRQGALLPKQFTTKLCVRFAVAPGIFTSDLRRAVSKHLKFGRIPMDADEEQIISYIEHYGPEALAEEGRKLRLSIGRNGRK